MPDPGRLLAPDEPPAFTIAQEQGRSAFLLTCDHASARVPRSLRSLGLAAEDLQRHIASDIGVAALARRLAVQLDAFLILQGYSRLVIDCNRPPGSPESIVKVSEDTLIPGNAAVSPAEAQLREREVFRPYHDRLDQELRQREAQGRRTVLVAMHSFVASFRGQARQWHAGVLYGRDNRLALALLEFLQKDERFLIGNNEPYAVSDSTDYAIPVYGEQRALLHVGIELRQDLIADETGQKQWADRLSTALRGALMQLEPNLEKE